MNKIFKVIFNHATQTWVATSELSKARGKVKSAKTNKLSLLAVSMLGGLGLISGVAQGATIDDKFYAENDTIGLGNNLTLNDAQKSVAVGDNVTIQRNENGTGCVTQYAVVIGANSVAASSAVVTIGYNASTYADSTIAIGNSSTALHFMGISIGAGTYTAGPGAIALGGNANATKNNTIAIGNNSNVSASGSIGLGANVSSTGANSVVIGQDSCSTGRRSVIVGWNSSVTGYYSNAIGETISISGNNTVAIGSNISASTDNSVILGTNSSGSESVNTTNNVFVSFGNDTITYEDFCGTVDGSGYYVSVGSSGNERKIVNVAAGNITATSTEAINGSQLYSVISELHVTDITAGSGLVTSNISSGVYTLNVTTGTLSANSTTGVVTGTEVSYTDAHNTTVTGNIATVTSVAQAINKSGFTLSGNSISTLINPGDTVNFANGTGTTLSLSTINNTTTISYNVNIDNSTIKTNDSGQLIVSTATITKDTTDDGDGNYTSGNDTTSLITANSVASIINEVVSDLESQIENATPSVDNTTIKTDNNGSLTVVTTSLSVDTTTGNVLATEENALVTAGSVATAINDAISNSSLSADNVTIKDTNGTLSVITTEITTEDGNYTATNGSALVNGTTLASALNDLSSNLSSENVSVEDDGSLTTGTNSTVSIGDNSSVTIGSGSTFTVESNSTVDMGGNVVTNVGTATSDYDAVNYKLLNETVAALKKDITNASVSVDDTTITNDNGTLSVITSSFVTNTDGSLELDTINGSTETGLITAATMSDVITNLESQIDNAGWNVTLSDNTTETVSSGDLVEFTNGTATTATVISDDNGIEVNYSVNVDNTTITVDETNNTLTVVTANLTATDDGSYTVENNATSALVTAGALASTINSVSTSLSTSISSNSVSVNSGGSFSVGANSTVDMGGNVVTNVGTAVNGTDAVNYNLLNATITEALSTVSSNLTYEVNSNTINVNEGGSISVGANSTVDMGGNQITNVGAGVNATDAVNVQQLNDSVQNINKNISNVDKNLRAGIAGTNAAASLPQVTAAGDAMFSVAVGYFKGQSAAAVGYSRSSDTGKVVFQLQGNVNSQGDVGGGAGVGFRWK